MTFRRMSWVTLLLLAALSGSVALSVNFAGRASAEVYTCGSTSSSNYHDGKYQQQSNDTGPWEGSKVDIKTQYGAVCDTNTSSSNFTNSYGMILGDVSNGFTTGWAQSGFIRWYNHCTVYFAQQERAYGLYAPTTKYGTTCLSTGVTNTYTQVFIPSCSCINSNINETNYLTTTWNPFNNWDYFSPQFSGEAYYKQSDMPGNAANLTQFTAIKGENYSDNWVTYPCTLTQQNDGSATRADGEKWYIVNNSTCPSFRIYTDTAG